MSKKKIKTTYANSLNLLKRKQSMTTSHLWVASPFKYEVEIQCYRCGLKQADYINNDISCCERVKQNNNESKLEVLLS